MAKAAGEKPKPTGKKKTPAKDEKPQAERFVETARLISADETGKAFEDAFARMIKKQSQIASLKDDP